MLRSRNFSLHGRSIAVDSIVGNVNINVGIYFLADEENKDTKFPFFGRDRRSPPSSILAERSANYLCRVGFAGF